MGTVGEWTGLRYLRVAVPNRIGEVVGVRGGGLWEGEGEGDVVPALGNGEVGCPQVRTRLADAGDVQGAVSSFRCGAPETPLSFLSFFPFFFLFFFLAFSQLPYQTCIYIYIYTYIWISRNV